MRIKVFLLSVLIIFWNCKETVSTISVTKNKGQPGILLAKNHSLEKPSVTDTVFSDVIELLDRDMMRVTDSVYFIKPVAKHIKTPVFFITERIPLKNLPWIYPEFDRKIIITPNWIQYEITADQTPPGIICAEPTASSVIYEFLRVGNKMQKDSVVMPYGFPEFITSK